MIFNLIDRKIRQAFSNAAMQYDVLSGLHKEIGRELVTKIQDTENVTTILDVGMGTGWLTNRLANYFPDAAVVGMDSAGGMIEFAGEIIHDFQIVRADARALPFKDEAFDMIVSNLAYQWIEDLAQAFSQCYSKLKAPGVFSLTLFGRETFNELFTSLEQASQKKNGTKDIPIRRLASREDVHKALDVAGFKNVEVSNEKIQVRFPDMMAMVKWIKDIGANSLEKEIFIGRELLNQANEYYQENFKDRLGIYATFEVIWVQGKK